MKGNAIVHYLKYLLGLDMPETQTTAAERQAIREYAQSAKLCIEIGVFEGVNTIAIAEAMDADGLLFGIDPFFKGRLGICYHEKIVKHAIKKRNLGNKIKLIPMLSFNITTEVADIVDFIFIDGDHSLEGIKRDWELFSTKVKKGGIIALHDTSVPTHDLTVANLGSYHFFNSKIKNDERFCIVDTVDSLNILRRN